MTGIKSLADELRESLKAGEGQKRKTPKSKGSRSSKETVSPDLSALFIELEAYELKGNEKLLIRLDERTVFLLKQLKIQKGIDMNKAIAFFIKSFFESKPELTEYIKETLKTIEI